MERIPTRIPQAESVTPQDLARRKQGLEKFSGRDLSPVEKEKLKEASRDFEAMFLQEVFKAMDKATARSGLVDGGQGEAMFKDMLLYERARVASRAESFGLASTMYRQLTGEKWS